jgi:hypothetical protein
VNVAGAVQALLDRLHAAGIRAVDDERDLNPPCVFVAPPAITWRFARNDFEAEMVIWCVTGSAGRSIDLVNLGELLDQVTAALQFAAVRGEPADLLVPDQAGPLPAYRLTWTDRVRQDRITSIGDLRHA